MSKHKTEILIDKRRKHGLSLLPICVLLLSGCALTQVKEVSDVPKSLEIAAHEVNDDGYPDLLNLPIVPKDMRTDAQWSEQKKELTALGKNFSKLEIAQTLENPQANMDKLLEMRDSLAKNPDFAIATSNLDAIAWAARMRAILNNLPPTIEKK